MVFFARAKQEVEALPSRGYELRKVSSDSRQALAFALRREYEEVERDYKAGRPGTYRLCQDCASRDDGSSPSGTGTASRLQLERWTPPPATVGTTNFSDSGSSQVVWSISSAAMAAVPDSARQLTAAGVKAYVNDCSNAHQQQQQQQQKKKRKLAAIVSKIEEAHD